MKLYVEATFPVAPEAVWDVFDSEAFQQRLRAETNMTSELLEKRMDGTIEVTRLKFVSGNDLPKVVGKALGAERLTYEQTNRFDKANNRLSWTVVLPMMPDRIKVAGTTTVTPLPSGGSKRVIDGDIEVKVALIGGQIEKTVVGEFEKSMQRAVQIAQDLIKAGR